MKMGFIYSIAFVLIFTAVVSVDSYYTPTNHVEQQIVSLLNKWRRGAVETNLFPLPSLKVINISPIDSSYDGKGINIKYSTGDLRLTGLNNFTVEHLNVTQTVDDIYISIKLNVPVLTLSSDQYKLKGRAYFVYPLHGSGKLTINFRYVTVLLKVHFASVDGISTKISDFLIEYNISNVEANLENSSWPINQVLTKEGVDIVKSYQEEIDHAIWGYVVPYANKYLANISPKDLSKIVTEMSMNSYLVPDNK